MKIDHVNAHGTGTRLNDWIETQALIKAFGPRAGRLMISATKASTGHLLGASGSVEFVFTLRCASSICSSHGELGNPDPECRSITRRRRDMRPILNMRSPYRLDSVDLSGRSW